MILVDSADISALTKCLALPGIQGFTTNPTLITRSRGQQPQRLSMTAYQESVLNLIRALPDLAPVDGIRREVMIQAVGLTDDILTAAQIWQQHIDAKQWRLWIKLLPEWTHLAAIRGIRTLGICTLATAVYTPMQAQLAFDAGADGIAVYLGRYQKADAEWGRRIAELRSIARRLDRTLLLASLADLASVTAALEYSSDVTVPATIAPQLLDSPLSAVAIAEFAQRVG